MAVGVAAAAVGPPPRAVVPSEPNVGNVAVWAGCCWAAPVVPSDAPNESVGRAPPVDAVEVVAVGLSERVAGAVMPVEPKVGVAPKENPVVAVLVAGAPSEKPPVVAAVVVVGVPNEKFILKST